MTGMIDVIITCVGVVVYMLLGWAFFMVINSLDSIFRSLAGMGGDYKLGASAGDNSFYTDGGLIYDLLRTDIIKKLIISILILAAFLLIIFTLMAFLKNVYAQKQKTAKEIISNSLKGALYFIFVPVCTLLGVYLGNIFLKAVDRATSLSGGTTMSGKLFISSAYDANKFRTGELTASAEDVQKLKDLAAKSNYPEQIGDGLTVEEYADLLDDVFARSPGYGERYSFQVVDGYYNVGEINYLILVVGGCFILYVLASLAFAMARRIYIMLIWFVISPACCAMFPIDEGKMVGKYKDEMMKQVLAAYGAVAGVNLFYSVMPLIDDLVLGNSMGSGFFNMFITICGLLCVKELVSSLSSLVGGEDALGKGSSLMKSTTGAMKKYAGGAAKGISKFSGKVAANYANMRDNEHGRVASFFGAVGLTAGKDAAKGTMKGLLGIDVDETKKAFKDSKKAQTDENTKRGLDDFVDQLKNGGAMVGDSMKTMSQVLNEGVKGWANFVKEFTLRGGSKEDAIKILAKESERDELDISRTLAKFDKDKEIVSTSVAQTMPTASNLEAEVHAAVNTLNASAASASNIAGRSTANDGGNQNAFNTYNQVKTEVSNGRYDTAQALLGTIDASQLNAGQLKIQVAEMQQAVASYTSAQTAITTSLTKLRALFDNAASSVGGAHNGETQAALNDAATSIQNASSDLATAGTTVSAAITELRKKFK